MKRFAAHRVLTSRNDRERKLWVVTLEGTRVLSLAPFTEEVPFTEWIGGWILVTSTTAAPLTFPCPLATFLQTMLPDVSSWNEKGEALSNTPQVAWYISPEEVAQSLVTRPRLLPALI
jgi:hypothetical protein